MLKPKRILFLSAPFGHGHVKAAHAVATAVKKLDETADVRCMDVFDEYPDLMGRILTKTYLRFIAAIPHAYGTIYKFQNRYGRYLSGRKIMHRAGAARMLAMIKRVQPSAVVCTHFLPAGILDYLISRRLVNIPVYGIVTDYSLHYWWVFGNIKKYYVGTEDMLEEFAAFGIGKKQVEVTGIPTALKEFSESKNVIISRLGLSDKMPVVAIMGGGTGMLPLDEIVQCLDKLPEEFQIVAMAGTNVSMYRKLLQLGKVATKPLHVYSYIDFVNEVMTISDLIISKPGGLTTAETLCLGLPMVVFRPIPGHETDNTGFLLRHNATVVAENLSEVAGQVSSLLACPEKLSALRLNAKFLGRKDAARKIAESLLRNS